jgi:hypothetical protein
MNALLPDPNLVMNDLNLGPILVLSVPNLDLILV